MNLVFYTVTLKCIQLDISQHQRRMRGDQLLYDFVALRTSLTQNGSTIGLILIIISSVFGYFKVIFPRVMIEQRHSGKKCRGGKAFWDKKCCGEIVHHRERG